MSFECIKAAHGLVKESTVWWHTTGTTLVAFYPQPQKQRRYYHLLYLTPLMDDVSLRRMPTVLLHEIASFFDSIDLHRHVTLSLQCFVVFGYVYLYEARCAVPSCSLSDIALAFDVKAQFAWITPDESLCYRHHGTTSHIIKDNAARKKIPTTTTTTTRTTIKKNRRHNGPSQNRPRKYHR
jgi:hypothetical protein